MKLYGRVIELFVDSTLFYGHELTIQFSIPFDNSDSSNVAEVQIYNLTQETINNIKKGSSVILNAGYRGDAGAVLLGVAERVYTEWQGVDKITTIQVVDGSDSWFNMPVQKSYAEGMTAEEIINDLTAVQSGLMIGALNLPRNHVYLSGKTVKGTLANVIREIAKDCGATCHVTKGKVFIRPSGQGDITGFILNSDSGLIASPTQTVKSVNGKDIYGWSVRCLLNHRMTTDALIQITSRTANGTFKVEKGRHDGVIFETEIEVYPL
jgi:hypothetical protein